MRISISFVFVACASCAGQPLIAALITMAPRNVVSFLAGSVRLLQKRVDMLESVLSPKTLLRLESLVPPPGIFDLQPADVHLAALVNELMKDDNVSASDAIEPKLLDGAIQRAEAVLRASDAIEPKLLDDAFQRDEAFFVFQMPLNQNSLTMLSNVLKLFVFQMPLNQNSLTTLSSVLKQLFVIGSFLQNILLKPRFPLSTGSFHFPTISFKLSTTTHCPMTAEGCRLL